MLKRLLLGAAPLMMLATPAVAAITISPSAPAGTFGNDGVTCTSGTTNCSFTDTITFVTPDGYNQVAATLTSGPALTDGQDIFFGPLGLLTGVTLNGQSFNLLSTGTTEFATLGAISLVAGATNTLSLTGTVGTSGSGSYAGTLNFNNVAPLPETGTWLMMILGFGAIGWMMRRNREQVGNRFRLNYA